MNLYSPLEISKSLRRFPYHPKDLLQAYDSADELILEHLSTFDLRSMRILIVGDQFGAISCALKGLDISVYTDSYLSFRGIQENLKGGVQPFSNLSELSGIYDLVVMKVPKNSSFFEDVLCNLTAHLNSQSLVVCGAMIKYLSKISFDLLNQYLGHTTTSLAKKKARLVFAKFLGKSFNSPYPAKVLVEGFKKPFVNHSNLFSREKLDIGTRFFLDHLPQGECKTILDLGCANGIIGIAAKALHPSAEIIFTDESAMAIQSAKENFRNHCSSDARFLWTNMGDGIVSASVDLVLCNPPFHQGHSVGDDIAKQMFTQSYHLLKLGGRIRVIGNGHLFYPAILKKIFGNSSIVAKNSKFTIVDAFRK